MKPCRHQEKTLALLAAGALVEEEAQPLRHHLESCDGCRAYVERMEAMCLKLGEPAREMREMRLPDGFTARWRERLAEETSSYPGSRRGEPTRVADLIRAWFCLPRMTMAAGMIACLLLLILVRPDESGTKPAGATAEVTPDPRPTVPNFPRNSRTQFAYQTALRESPEALDALILRQARHDRGGEGMTAFAQRPSAF